MQHRSSRFRRLASLLIAAAMAHATAVQANERFVFLTDWYAQAEHGGYYQALTSGLYRAAGLDVTIRMGGPQVNLLQLLAAGQADCIMGSSDIQVLRVREQGVPAVTVAAIFQKDPQIMIAHPDVHTLADLKGRSILISTGARDSYWPWLKTRYGLQDSQARPYTYSLQPFIAGPMTAVQGYVTADPYILRKAGVEARVLLFSDFGWPAYANTIVCMDSTLRTKRSSVQAFVNASIAGWTSYLDSNRAAADALIRKENPLMTQAQIDFAVGAMKERGLVAGGDAATGGIGTLNPSRLQQTYDLLVQARLLDPAKAPLPPSFDTTFVKDARTTR